MKNHITSKSLLAATMAVAMLQSGGVARAQNLPRSTPEEQGVPSANILSLVGALDKIDTLNSFMLLRHGHVVAEGWWTPYRATARHSLYSLSKSFTSTAVGLAVAEGKLSVDDEVLKFFPEHAPEEPSNNLKAMRVSDLLRMSTGHQTEPGRKPDEVWTKVFLAHPVPFKPGTHFLYNTSATYMQSAIVQKVTGQTVLDYLQSRLFAPLGIEDPTWETSPQGISTGGYGLSIRTEDIAKFGQLLLQRGKWQDRQLVPAEWIDTATARQTSNGSRPFSDWDQGYGYQFWRCRHGAYRGDGAFGQYCLVLPEKDAVIAITSGLRDMQQVLDLVWDHLLPAFQPAALATARDTQEQLQGKLKNLSVRFPESDGTPAIPGRKTYSFPSNDLKVEAVTIEPTTTGELVLTARIDGEDQRITCGKGEWLDGRATWALLKPQVAAAAYAGHSDGYTIKLCFYETPFIVTLRLKLAGEKLIVNSETNVAFIQNKHPEIVGKAQ